MRCASLTALLLAGCGPSSSEQECSPRVDCALSRDAEASFEVGTGDPYRDDFTPLPEDGRVRLNPGEQGGYHAFLQISARGFCPHRVATTWTVTMPGSDRVFRQQRSARTMVAGPEGTWVYPQAEITFLCPSQRDGLAVVDQPLELEVTVEDEPTSCDALPEGPRRATRRVTIVPTCDEGDATCSTNSCEGCAAPGETEGC